MDTRFLNLNPRLIHDLAGRFPEKFTYIDVGASGGIPGVWYSFGDALVAYAFDPLVNEVERLNGLRPPIGNVEYVDAFIVRAKNAPDEDPSIKQDCVFPRSSAARSLQISGSDFTKEVFNAGADVVLSTNRFSVDEFVRERGLAYVDFIKVDTDGNDYSVLLGANETLRTKDVLGVTVEVSFNTEPHPEASLFSRHDAYLRSLGFRLFDLDVRRYTRAALPGKFRYNIAAQTLAGQVDQGDAVYLRDFADPDFVRSGERPALAKLLKMVALFEIFGQNDCAVELIQAYREDFEQTFDIEQLVSVLCEEFTGTADYATYMQTFERYMRERRYAEFPDDYTLQAEGTVLAPKGDANALVFKPN